MKKFFKLTHLTSGLTYEDLRRSNRLMLGRYAELKAQLPPGTILFYQVGTFFETFEEDAKTISKELSIRLTSRFIHSLCRLAQVHLTLVVNGLRNALLEGVWDQPGQCLANKCGAPPSKVLGSTHVTLTHWRVY